MGYDYKVLHNQDKQVKGSLTSMAAAHRQIQRQGILLFLLI